KIERQILDEKFMFVDEDGKSLSKADSMVNADSDGEVKDVFNKTVGFMTSTSLKGGSESGDDQWCSNSDGTELMVSRFRYVVSWLRDQSFVVRIKVSSFRSVGSVLELVIVILEDVICEFGVWVLDHNMNSENQQISDPSEIHLIEDIDVNGYLFGCNDDEVKHDGIWKKPNEDQVNFICDENQINDDKIIGRKLFVCNKQGFKKQKGDNSSEVSKKRRRDVRTSCEAELRISKTKGGKWCVDIFNDTHNHDLTTTPTKVMKYHSHNKFHRSMACKSLMVELGKSGLIPCQVRKAVNAMKSPNEPTITSKHRSNTMLNEFVIQFDKDVDTRRAAEEDEDFKTMNLRPMSHVRVLCSKHMGYCVNISYMYKDGNASIEIEEATSENGVSALALWKPAHNITGCKEKKVASMQEKNDAFVVNVIVMDVLLNYHLLLICSVLRDALHMWVIWESLWMGWHILEVGEIVLLDKSKFVEARDQLQLAALYCGATSGFELYDVKVVVRLALKLLPEIKRLLLSNLNRLNLFRRTVFGPWLDLPSHYNDNHLMHYVLQHQDSIPIVNLDPTPAEKIQAWFDLSISFFNGIVDEDGKGCGDDYVLVLKDNSVNEECNVCEDASASLSKDEFVNDKLVDEDCNVCEDASAGLSKDNDVNEKSFGNHDELLLEDGDGLFNLEASCRNSEEDNEN
nr:hypothetical protein [Tanacetum cinerariifolium]